MMTTELEIKTPPSNPTALLHKCCVSLSKSLHLSEPSVPHKGVIILFFRFQRAGCGSSQEMRKGPDFQNILSAALKIIVYYYPIFQMEKPRPREVVCSRSHSTSETDSGLEPRVPIPSSELSLSKDPMSNVAEERQARLWRCICLPASG